MSCSIKLVSSPLQNIMILWSFRWFMFCGNIKYKTYYFLQNYLALNSRGGSWHMILNMCYIWECTIYGLTPLQVLASNSMGNKQSKKRHANCSCDLYDQYQHCCKQTCFGADRGETEKALTSALKKYKADYLTSKIMQYLPDTTTIIKMDPTSISKDVSYHSFTYEPINSIVQDSKPPCSIWTKSIRNAYSDKIPEIKVSSVWSIL